MQLIEKYFPDLTAIQKDRIKKLYDLYVYWNERINLISRKDIDNLYERHILHSMSIAKFFEFTKDTKIADVGTGGGLPGIPLAILFPDVHFILIDSTQKKIKVVEEIVQTLGLENATPLCQRFESLKEQFDYITGRGVAAFPEFVKLVNPKLSNVSQNEKRNGVIYLKGGDFYGEIAQYKNKIKLYNISDVFKEEYFSTKKIIYLPC
jgi:16S rRNA (guanine527-N7)-methyltransferase